MTLAPASRERPATTSASVGSTARALVSVLVIVAVSGCALPGPRHATPPVTSVGRAAGSPASSAVPAPDFVRIAAAGDIACEAPYTVTAFTCQHDATARLISLRPMDAVLPLGDTQYESGGLAGYQASYDLTWGAFRELSYPVIGNHEYRDVDAQGFLSYFGAQVPNERVRYARDLGAWRIYMLNSNCDWVDCAAQVAWLERDLAAHPRRCSLAAMHHPRFSSGPHGNSAFAAKLWPTLDAHQVDVVLAGHDHHYERFAPQHTSGAIAPDGLRSFVVGTGGKSLYALTTTQPGSLFRYAAGAGVLFLTLKERRYTWRFRTTDGTLLDSGTASCLR